MIRTLCITFSLLMASVVYGQTQTRMAYVLPPDWQFPGTKVASACVFLGIHANGQFKPAADLNASFSGFDRAFVNSVNAFSVGQHLIGITPDGQKLQTTVNSIDPKAINELGIPTLTVDIPDVSVLRGGALLMTSEMPLRVLRPQTTRLNSTIEKLLRVHAQQLWNRHLPERTADERPSRFTLKRAIVESVKELPGVIVVRFPMDIVEDNLNRDGRAVHDDRGQMFFIYSTTDRRIIREEFGHPEWSPGSTVRKIKPWLYFKPGTDNSVLFVGQNTSGWESSEVGLFDLQTGREVLTCW
jgi:hypothetical protein